MKTIRKWEIIWHKVEADCILLTIPEDSIIIHAGLDPSGKHCIWAEVDTEKKLIVQKVWIFGTGNPMPKFEFRQLKHVASFVERCFVWHVYA